MGESKSEEQAGDRRHNASEANNVRERLQENRCSTTCTLGEGESREEDRLTATMETPHQEAPGSNARGSSLKTQSLPRTRNSHLGRKHSVDSSGRRAP